MSETSEPSNLNANKPTDRGPVLPVKVWACDPCRRYVVHGEKCPKCGSKELESDERLYDGKRP